MKKSFQAALDHALPQYSHDDSYRPGIAEFRRMVLAYYDRHGRDMPWRNTIDPYKILVSEIMLQQTQVERVTSKFPEFIRAFPDFSSLAAAPLSSVLAVWQGMGYNRRAIALQKCAIRVMDEFNGILPADVRTLATFPGIGEATASSIAAFAFNQPVVFIETNIRRVFIHFFFADTGKISDAEIFPVVEKTLYSDNPRLWYWALMDLGTCLKKTVNNLNRRSKHYIRQAPFEGSDRKIRGIIIRFLIKCPGASEKQIVDLSNEDPIRITRILDALHSEGFIVRRNNLFFLSE